jgi:carbon-monoxide dehydrogenase small subunit
MTEMSSSGNPALCEVSFTVNGESKTVCVYPMERLLDVLRHQLELTGAKEGCGEGECGSCSVLLNGVLVNSCLVPVLQVRDADIFTIEGLAAGERLDGLQEAFLSYGGAQCGICTPGMILAAHHLLQRNLIPRWMRSGKGYPEIFAAAPATFRSLKRWRKLPDAG